MNILITGALGYLGSELVKKLEKNSHKLVLVDNLYNNNKNILKTSKKIKFIKKDIEKLNFNNHLKNLLGLGGQTKTGSNSNFLLGCQPPLGFIKTSSFFFIR